MVAFACHCEMVVLELVSSSHRDSVSVLLSDFVCFFNTFVCWYKLSVARGEARGAAYRTVDQKTRSTTHTPQRSGHEIQNDAGWFVLTACCSLNEDDMLLDPVFKG